MLNMDQVNSGHCVKRICGKFVEKKLRSNNQISKHELNIQIYIKFKRFYPTDWATMTKYINSKDEIKSSKVQHFTNKRYNEHRVNTNKWFSVGHQIKFRALSS